MVLLFGTVLNIASGFAIILGRDRWPLHYIEFVPTVFTAPWPIEPPEAQRFAWPAQSDDSGWGVQASQGGPLRLSWAGRSFEPEKLNAGGLVRRWGSATEYERAGPIMHERTFTLDVSEFGWPFVAFRTAVAQRIQQARDRNDRALNASTVDRWAFGARGWRPARTFSGPAAVSLSSPPAPIWPGIALNTLTLGIAATALCLGLRRLISVIRRTIRRFRQRGRTGEHCPHCGYSREGLPSPETPCPECGKTVDHPSASGQTPKA